MVIALLCLYSAHCKCISGSGSYRFVGRHVKCSLLFCVARPSGVKRAIVREVQVGLAVHPAVLLRLPCTIQATLWLRLVCCVRRQSLCCGMFCPSCADSLACCTLSTSSQPCFWPCPTAGQGLCHPPRPHVCTPPGGGPAAGHPTCHAARCCAGGCGAHLAAGEQLHDTNN